MSKWDIPKNTATHMRDGRIRRDIFIKPLKQEPKELPEDTALRYKLIRTIAEKVKNGEDLDEVCLKLAESEEAKKVYSIYVKHGAGPINELLKNAYLAMERNKEKRSQIYGTR